MRNTPRKHIRNLRHSNITLFTDEQESLNHLTQQPAILLPAYRIEPMDDLEAVRKIKRFNPDIYLVVISGSG